MDGELERIPTALGALAVRRIGDGRPAVLWHSMFVDGTSWDRVVPLLPGRTLLVVDGPGWGASDPLTRTTDVPGSVDAAEEVVRQAAGEPVDWVGNAWGGHVGMGLAATRPGLVRSLVAISAPVQPIEAGLRRRIELLIPVLRALGPVGPVRAAVLDGVLTEASQRDAALVASVVEAMRRPPRSSVARAARSFILNRTDITALMPRIVVPALFVSGDDRGDWTPAQARAAAALARSARAVTIPGSRTLLPLEQPAALAREILAFWSTVPE